MCDYTIIVIIISILLLIKMTFCLLLVRLVCINVIYSRMLLMSFYVHLLFNFNNNNMTARCKFNQADTV